VGDLTIIGTIIDQNMKCCIMDRKIVLITLHLASLSYFAVMHLFIK